MKFYLKSGLMFLLPELFDDDLDPPEEAAYCAEWFYIGVEKRDVGVGFDQVQDKYLELFRSCNSLQAKDDAFWFVWEATFEQPKDIGCPCTPVYILQTGPDEFKLWAP